MHRVVAGTVVAILMVGMAGLAGAADIADGKRAFQQCMACHSLKPGENKIGPTLSGVVGRKAASIDGFNYSPAMRSSGLVWDDANLHRYLANPKAVVPEGKMAFAGVKDAQRLENLIEFLKQGTP